MILEKGEKDGFCNTRLNLGSSVSVGIDYLRVKIICEEDEISQVFNFIDHKYLSVEMGHPWRPGGSCPYFANRIQSPLGVDGGFTVDEDTGECKMMFQLSGQYFSHRNMTDTWRLFMGLKYEFGAECSRIDIAVDDYSYSVIPFDKMVKAWEEGDNFNFSSYKVVGSGRSRQSFETTHYFGSRDSGKMVRIYNHRDECMRFEAEFKRGYSRIVFDFLASLEREDFDGVKKFGNEFVSYDKLMKKCGEMLFNSSKFASMQINFDELHGCNGDFELMLQKICGSIAVSCIDFRDKSGLDSNRQSSYRDTKRLSWYQDFMDKVGTEIRVKVRKKESNVAKTVKWLERQVSKTTAMLRCGLGAVEFRNFMYALIRVGCSKMSYSDYKKADYIKDYPEVAKLSFV